MGFTLIIRRRIIGAGLRVGALSALVNPTFDVAAQGIEAISSTDATKALKAALEKGANAAVSKLGVDGGFLNNEKVHIPLPPSIARIEKALRFAGLQDRADQLVTTMNQAAEQAVPLAKPLLVNAIKNMSVTDARKILSGGDTSVTDFFKEKTAQPLADKFLPVVKKKTDSLGVAQQYNQLADKASKFGLVKGEDANIERYVTRKALDGLYLMVAEEEKSIRANPVEAGSALLSKVFGALR
jgi:hypothetical protein